MINRKHFSCAWIVFVVAVAGTHLGPECPRHRGLPAGFSRTENIYKNRALYRLDLRSAIKGYIPGKEYKLRVQTTFRKLKFNDATLVIDAIDERCGAGYLVTDTDELYSPKDCPAIVTTQQKEPMGRANFKWVAPSCGCVHFRVRVHANSTYYIEDETVRNGPLARTVCPKVGTVTEPITKETTTTVMPEALTRNQRLKLLCDVTVVNKADSVMKNEDFLSRRPTSKLNSFEIERLNLAVEQRHLEVLTCCALETEFEKSECFADIRRVRIDTFCGDGEPDIPITETRYNWTKQRQPECCPQIGEDRYRCFNYTLNEEEMLKDSHGHHSSLDMDDFDPVNYVEDYPQADEIKMKFSKKLKQMRKVSRSDDSTETGTDDQYKTANETEHVTTHGSHTNETYDTGNDLEEKSDVDTDESSSTDVVNAKNSEPMEDSRDDVQTRNLSIEECCMNGIDAGIKVLEDGFHGCFKMADRFHAFFTKWNRRCDRHFVICCMRVIDGLTSTKRPLI